jgi:hypothetical protein
MCPYRAFALAVVTQALANIARQAVKHHAAA